MQRDSASLLLVALLAAACDLYDASLLDGTAGPFRNVCGNGRVDDGEMCDTAIAKDSEGACPTACVTDDGCNPRALAGMACETQCVSVTITRAVNDDGCCPKGSGPTDDSDCGFCGDQILGPTEKCEPPEQCLTREACTSYGRCVAVSFSGAPESCTSACEITPLMACARGDGCCPPGCDSESDDDCSSTCGNGMVEPDAGESCEPTSTTDPCPDGCDDDDPCSQDITVGSAQNCNLTCQHMLITMPISGDGCCPTGASSLNDEDCAVRCGNGIVESGETCDPCSQECTDTDACTRDVLSGTACNESCAHIPITAAAGGDGCCPGGANAATDSDCTPVCGNGVVEPGEACEGDGRCGSDCQQPFPASLVHRYRFEGTGTTAVDSVGGSNGMIVNTTLGGSGSLRLDGTNLRHVNLPNGLISSLTDVTIEAWITWEGGAELQRVFDFGMNTSGENNSSGSKTSALNMLASNSSGNFSSFIDFTDAVDDSEVVVKASSSLTTGRMQHVAVTFRDATDTFALYRDGALIDQDTATTGHLSSIDDRNNWIGRGNRDGTLVFKGTIYEFRIYSAALSASALQASAAAGPDP